ncbi:MAG: hypothetical protein JXN61_18505 [Sedimentisphaerales bacterium]|nr:hypothetical protein [Sedimentisphaerales bacterium]
MAGSHGKSSKGGAVAQETAGANLNRDRGAAIGTSIFFLAFYLCTWLYLDLQVIYYSAGMLTRFPVFFRGWPFFREFTSYPGGLGGYVAAFLAQLFHYSWLAAGVVTAQALLLCLCTGYFLKTLGLRRLYFLRFAGAIVLLVFCSQYMYHFAMTTTVCIALVFLCLYLKLTASSDEQVSGPARRRAEVRAGALFLVLSVILYYVAGGAFLLFAALCAVRAARRRRWGMATLCVLGGALIPYVEGVLIFGVCPEKAFTESLPGSCKMDFGVHRGAGVIGGCVVLFIVAAGLGLYRLKLAGGKAARGKKTARRKQSKSHGGAVELRWIVDSAMLFAVVGMVALLSYNGPRGRLLKIHCYACRRMWPEVLKAAGHDSSGYFAINAVNQALYHTGRLGDEMFAYPQHPDALLLSGQDQVLLHWHKFDTQLDLGLVNMAQKNFTECMEVYGEHPLILKRLALINMVKRNIGAAKIYLRALSKTLFEADWARYYLVALDTDPELSTDRRIGQLRSVALKKDHSTIFVPAELAYLTLLEENSKNRMAFEYLMTLYMLGKQVDKVTGSFKRISEFGDKEFPRHYQEAICIYAYSTGKPVYLEGRTLDPRVRKEIEEFSGIFNSFGKNKQAAVGPLAREFGGTYFFYHLFGFSGVEK